MSVISVNEYHVAAFSSTQLAIGADDRVKATGIIAELIPTPLPISAGCGLALRYTPADGPFIRQVLTEVGLSAEGYYRVFRTDGSWQAEREED